METELTVEPITTSLTGLRPGVEVARERITDLISAIWDAMRCDALTREQLSDLKLYSVELREQLDLMDTLTIYQ